MSIMFTYVSLEEITSGVFGITEFIITSCNTCNDRVSGVDSRSVYTDDESPSCLVAAAAAAIASN